MNQLGSGFPLQQLAGQMRHGADARRAERQLVRIGLGVGDEFGHGRHRKPVADRKHLRRTPDQAERRKIVDRIPDLLDRRDQRQTGDAARAAACSRRGCSVRRIPFPVCRRPPACSPPRPAGVKCLRITSANVRAAVSAGPPALNGTMMVTAREGNSCAGERDGAAPATNSATAAISSVIERMGIPSPNLSSARRARPAPSPNVAPSARAGTGRPASPDRPWCPARAAS